MKSQKFSKKQHWFHAAWLVFGLLQLFAFSGCGPSEVAASTPPATADSLLSSNSPAEVTPQHLLPGMPVRVSRTFFDGQLTGGIALEGSAPLKDLPASWLIAPAPTPYADGQGCVSIGTPVSIRLCFSIMNDVESLGLNSQEMQVYGLDELITQQIGPPCAGVRWSVSLTQGSVVANTIGLQYLATPQAGMGCAAQPERVTLSLQKI